MLAIMCFLYNVFFKISKITNESISNCVCDCFIAIRAFKVY